MHARRTVPALALALVLGAALLHASPPARAGHDGCGAWPDQVMVQVGWSSGGCLRAGHGGMDEGFCGYDDNHLGVGPVTWENGWICANRVIVNPAAPVAPEAGGVFAWAPIIAGQAADVVVGEAWFKATYAGAVAGAAADGVVASLDHAWCAAGATNVCVETTLLAPRGHLCVAPWFYGTSACLLASLVGEASCPAPGGGFLPDACVALSALGAASGGQVAASGAGAARAELLAVSALGPAQAPLALSACSLAAACGP